jgi:hypothetical protein
LTPKKSASRIDGLAEDAGPRPTTLDNLSTHKMQRVGELIATQGVEVRDLGRLPVLISIPSG